MDNDAPVRDPLLEKVEATVRCHGLLPCGATVGVAVSGGPDSVALLAALGDLAPHWGWRLVVMHVNHGLRGRESGHDALFVRRLAARRRLLFDMTKIRYDKASRDLARVSEEFLREVRYRILAEMAGRAGASVIALGHHRDDLAETVLMHLLRGSGPAGMSGFRPKTRLGNVTCVRPLYECTRAEILDFCRRRGLRWREDRTNRDTRWLRNRIRHELLPMLERTYNPRLRDLLADNARWFQEDEAYFEAVARDALGLPRGKRRPPLSIPLPTLRALDPPVLTRLLRIWVMAVTDLSLPPTGRQIEELTALIRRQPPRGEVTCSGGVVFFIQGDTLTWWRPTDRGQRFARPPQDELAACDARETPPSAFRLTPEGEELRGKGRQEIVASDGQATLRIDRRRYHRRRQSRAFETAFARACGGHSPQALEQFFDADKIEEPLVVRNRRPGDRFHPLGAAGPKKLKDFLIDAKVPATLRSRLVLLCDRTKVLWVVGLRVGHPARLTEATETILRVRVTKPHRLLRRPRR